MEKSKTIGYCASIRNCNGTIYYRSRITDRLQAERTIKEWSKDLPAGDEAFVEVVSSTILELEEDFAQEVEYEQVGWQVIQKNGLSVGGFARSEEEKEDIINGPLFDPEIDTFRKVYVKICKEEI